MPVALVRRRKGSWKRARRFLSRDWQTYYIPVRWGWVVVAGRLGQQLRLVELWRDGTSKFKQTLSEQHKHWAKMKKKKTQQQTSDATHIAPLESVILGNHHSLVKHCAVTKYDDGDPRKAGELIIKTMGAAWIVECRDKDQLLKLVVIQQTLDDALTLAALLLDSEDAPWEPDTWAQQQAARASKKK